MLELREYELSELSQVLNTNGKQATERKLCSWNVNYEVSGYGRNVRFTLTSFGDEFKLYCFLELGFDCHTNLDKLATFFYHYLNDDEFMAMPFEVKQYRLERLGITISRQTISNWERKLEWKGFIARSLSQFYYYFAIHHTQRMATLEEYTVAWHDYWTLIDNGLSSGSAMLVVIEKYGGVPRKAPVAGFNGILGAELTYFTELVNNRMDNA